MRVRNWLVLVLSCAVFLLFQAHNTAIVKAQQSGGPSASFTVNNPGGVSMITSGSSAATRVGYAAISPFSGNASPAGIEFFGFHQNNILVSEAGVSATPAISSGRIYAEVNGPVNTGVAIANPGSKQATISFYFTDQNGGNAGAGSTAIPAGGQIAAFLNQAPFNAGSSFSGTFTLNSDAPVAVIALRGLTNERSEFLITTLPVTALSPPSSGTAYLPEFADGGGWTTQVVLVNPGDVVMTGTVQFYDSGSVSGNVTTAGQPVTVTTSDGQTANTFSYTIPARSSRRIQTAGTSGSTVVGSVRIVPSGTENTPSAVGIFSFKNAGITVTESGVSAAPTGGAFRMYAEASDPANGSIQTGIAIANPSSSSALVTFQLFSLAGTSTGLQGSVVIPANGQKSFFLNQISGFASLQTPFQGVLRMSTASPISVVGLRGRYNERSDFLITTTPPINETAPVSTLALYFPHLADGGGYTTQFVLFSGSCGVPCSTQATAGTLQFFNQAGTALTLSVSGALQFPTSPAPVITSVTPASPIVSTNSQVVTVTGTNFQMPGYALSITPPLYDGFAESLGPAQLQSATSTSFQVTIPLAEFGTYAFQVQNPSGANSNVVNLTTQFRTTGSNWIPEGSRSCPGCGDVFAIHLLDGRWRLNSNGFQTFISPDGLALTVELPWHGLPTVGSDGTPLQPRLPRVFKLANGDYRAYFDCGCSGASAGIVSALSHDEGVTWTIDPGVRLLTSAAVPTGFLSGFSVVPTGNGTWRAYFSPQTDGDVPTINYPMMSATSSDLLNWVVEPGNRIGTGATLTGTALHAKAIANSDGTVTAFYYRPRTVQGAFMYESTSTDGLTFSTETLLESLGNAADPEVVQVGNGLRIYYDWGDNHSAVFYSAINPTGARESVSEKPESKGVE